MLINYHPSQDQVCFLFYPAKFSFLQFHPLEPRFTHREMLEETVRSLAAEDFRSPKYKRHSPLTQFLGAGKQNSLSTAFQR